MNRQRVTMISNFSRINKKFFGVALLALLPLLASGQVSKGQVLDKIVAKVDNYIILKSEVEKTHLELLSRGQATSPDLQCQILQNLIMDKVMVAKAEIDSITILDAEVELNLDRRFSMMVAQIGSEKAIEEYYGKSVSEFKDELKPQVHEQLVIQKMEGVISQEITITPSEVKKFFKKIPQDSLPYFSKEEEVAEIVKFPETSKTQKQKIQDRANELRSRIVNGEDFEDIARRYSEDPGSAGNGGNYGWQSRGSFVPEYEAAVFKMKPGELSEAIQSDYGFHLIELIERRGNEYNSKHILLTTSPSESDLLVTEHYLDSIRTRIIEDSMSFEKLASEISDNIETAGSGGYFIAPDGSTRIAMGDLDPVIFFSIDTMKIGEISKPIAYRDREGKDAVRILYYRSSSPPHLANLEEDYQKIYAAAMNEKRSRAINAWFREARKEVFIEIDAELDHCPVLQ